MEEIVSRTLNINLMHLPHISHGALSGCINLSFISNRDDPYDQVIFPPDSNVAQGKPNFNDYEFNTGAEKVINSLIERTDPGNEFLRKQCEVWMELTTTINKGFTALGWSRIIPSFLHFLVRKQVDQLYTLASYSVRDVQYAIFNCGYSIADLLEECPSAPPGPESDPVLRRVKAVLNHPLGDYAVQVGCIYIFLLVLDSRDYILALLSF